MRVPRFYTRHPLHKDAEVSLEEEPSHHLRQVLRLRTGGSINLFNDNGDEYTTILTFVSKQCVNATVGTQIRREPDSKLTVHLLISISRGERMDFALQKATELGVCRITPVFTKRCVVKLNEKKSASRVTHWNKLVVNACEQSGRCRIPTIDHPVELKEAIARQNSNLALLLDHRSHKRLDHIDNPNSSVSILIGPEGGLSTDERDLADQHGFIAIRLGPRIMRTETAPLAMIAAIQTLWGDFCD
ncbi:MAG: 16S rRNA (uracil(1498)-N(3))-methyltransferase [Candidatus Thiodiazotropha sp. (ex Lucinoma aequizonata)]|nr:16S rRNA (uracil(1498)-N(3))-methyltransferase [Candidatus Thiodiazotropha sp. (ex Lucinoma aequizonata)]MCU7888690.1 16S rRNA (uracil(1498)-N(3))-methyltransferase [Candidatus Thiodiazotropha sp. (ex Lucinoma aequizonata)]MCU7895951.1 16S rRNA (uracil(1498)-N(3))-methyltransferase [Candidatus Thiodiazotropha sp. (ex Lucinoma aequizonata)]MCU7900549.1 16S rRNA (uracil(1498)-N(3))-methyltransferase [Candidatus Thiodiazotropha sp. (ex Lucinoma aequizonata)]MCU7904165.1 16S rRNA (uracil(1498)-N